VDQGVDKVLVAVAPPQKHGIDDIAVVVVDEFVARVLLDGFTQPVIDVVVPAQLLHHGVGLKPESIRNEGAVRVVRCRAHRCLLYRESGQGGRGRGDTIVAIGSMFATEPVQESDRGTKPTRKYPSPGVKPAAHGDKMDSASPQ